MSSLEFRLKKIDLALAITSCDSISRFASLVCVPVGITSFVVVFVQSLQESKILSQL